MNLTETQAFLTTLMRTIDRKVTLTIEPSKNTARPGITVHLVRDRRAGHLELSEASLQGAEGDLIRRNQLRTALKRTRDGMWETSTHIFSTKMERPKTDGGMSFYRSSPGGNRGKR